MKLGLFNKSSYSTETIVKGLARIPSAQANLVCLLGVLLGGPLFLISLLICLVGTREHGATLPVVLLVIGAFLFNLAMSLPYVVHLSKGIVNIRDSLCDDCKAKIMNGNE